MRAALVLLLAFSLGSLPTALWWARARGIDLRQVGSGNLGATNAYRALGARVGLAVLAIDMVKGGVAVVAARFLAPPPSTSAGTSAGMGASMDAGSAWPLAAAALAVLGHMLSPFAGFRGGKGVATGAGAMLVLAPAATLLAMGVFAVTVAATRFVSLGSILGALSLPLAVIATAPGVPGLAWAASALAALIVARHRSNIARLVSGTERRLGGPAHDPARDPVRDPAGPR